MKDITNSSFGKLTALYPTSKDKHGNYFWMCSCECGNKKEVRSASLCRGKTLTCGCSGKRYQKRPDGEAAFTELFGRYKKQASQRGYSFELEEDLFRELTQRLCHYCGASPSNSVSTHKNTGSYFYNGIDRKDNSMGYVSDNVVPCCIICNRAKNDLPYDIFISWLDNLLKFNKETINAD